MLLSSPSRTATATTTTTPSSAAASLEFLAKRRRIANGGATLRDTTGNAAVTPSNSILRKWGTSTTKTPTGQKPGQTHGSAAALPAPRYCPGDRDQLLRRLATFQELTDWTPKPDRINEIEWAKRGWVCQGKERLRCTLCSKELVVQLGRTKGGETGDKSSSKPESAEAAEAAEAAVLDKYVGLVVTAHEEDCLWRKKGCDDSLLRLQLASPKQALADLRQRYDELCVRKDFLPYEFNLRLPEGLDINAVLATLPPTFFDAPSTATSTTAPATTSVSTSSTTPNRVALALAVMGWQGLTNSRIGAVPNSASCHSCLRRLGLWMFKSKQVDLETNTVLEPAPMDHLNAVREHRFFCPWKNGSVQRNPGARSIRNGKSGAAAEPTPGWDVLVQMLKNDAYLRNRMTAGPTSSRLPPNTPSKATPGAAPVTPGRRPATAVDADGSITGTPGTLLGTPNTPGTGSGIFGDREAREEDDAAREAKDKERWARLRRVKSLFDTKGTMAKKLKRAGVGSTSRPGTGHSQSSLRPESQGQ
ncbi:hypothetical protein Sste5344_000830 [Sporothrix stenoceras]